jgi:predicted TIM-barrel fold metal-dependent hydrolase
VVKQIVALAVARGLWLHAHCDEAALEAIYAHDPRVKVIWAHTGFTTPLAQVERYLERYPTLVGELSYRSGVVAAGRVTPEWRGLFERHPNRFLLGSDTWNNGRWANYGEMMSGYRAWLADLPLGVARQIAWDNAARMFDLPPAR